MKPAERINAVLKRELAAKQRMLAAEVASLLEAQDPGLQRAAQSAIRRIEKGIALRVAKLLCPHTNTTTTSNRQMTWHRCGACKSYASEK